MSKTNLEIPKNFRGILYVIINNKINFICLFVYYILASLMLGASKKSFIFTFVIYGISLAIACSPLGEYLMKVFNQVRPLETQREKEYLIPLFCEVCENIKDKYNILNNIEICLINSMAINATAIGTHTIAITKGAMQAFTEDELKAIMAHEIAHILYKDTLANICIMIGNGLFTFLILILKFFICCINCIHVFLHKRKNVLTFVITVLKFTIEGLSFIIIFSMQIILMINSRKNEFRADKFSYELGYDREIIEVLYLLEKFSLGDNSTLIQKITASHPRITKRIEYLESLDEQSEYKIP